MAGSQHHPPMAQRIARLLPTLTRAQRRMADYVLAHPLQAATQTIDELASALGVSVATANRFARALEFDGYPQFRAALVLGFESALALVDKVRQQVGRPVGDAGVFALTLSEIGANVERTRQALDPESCRQAVAAIGAALDSRTLQKVAYELPLDGETRRFEARIAPCTPDTALTIVRDVTELEASALKTRRRAKTSG